MTRKTVQEIVGILEARAPSGTAEEWDNVGLLAGDPSWRTPGAVVAIDLSAEAIQKARERGFRLIINHHPCIFPKSRRIARITAGPGKTGLVFEAIRSGIAVAACHTNFDRCALGVPERIARGLGLAARGRLLDEMRGSLVKLVVFVPLSHAERVRDALARAGAGQVGDYDSCAFSAEGEGTFRGSRSSHPFLGVPGRLERAREARIETVFPRGLEAPILQAMRDAHPYEEVAYDLYPVEQHPSPLGMVRGLGYGFWGEFPQPKPFSEVIRSVRKLFRTEGFLLTGRPARAGEKIRRVAFAAGQGASVVEAAASLGCDLMITGEVGYHEALAGARVLSRAGGRGARQDRAMAILELGHSESELFFVESVKRWLSSSGLQAAGLRVRAQRIGFMAGGHR